MHATDIVGYTYQAANFCTGCIVAAIPNTAKVGLDLSNTSTEDALGLIAEHNAIDRNDQHTFDSAEFPKVIFASQVEDDEPCDECGDDIVSGEPILRGTAISSNHYSTDDQTIDAMSHLEHHHREAFDKVSADFPEFAKRSMSGSAFDTDAMGVDVEWGSWLCDAIENTEFVTWDDGEPYCTAKECRS